MFELSKSQKKTTIQLNNSEKTLGRKRTMEILSEVILRVVSKSPGETG